METLFATLLNHQWFEMKWDEMKGNDMKWKEKEKESKSSKQPASQQYICQYKIQYIVPNTFSNKESIAHKKSLHNLLKKIIHYPLIV